MPSTVQRLLATLPEEKKEARIAVRVPLQVKEVIDTAAEMVGATSNQFMAQAAYQAAQELIERERIVQLCTEDTEQFLALLDNPPAPTKTLKQAVKHFKESLSNAKN
ncbi:MAG: DUF1778 domain-containing protein [Chromatiales bacterium]|nr:DUF1778 domain-containing protein [Chromatiales bacterium]